MSACTRDYIYRKKGKKTVKRKMKNWYRHTDLGSHLSKARMVIAGFVATAMLFASCQSVEMDLPATEQGSILTQFNVSVSNAKLTSNGTRMSDAVVQQGQDLAAFRGMEDIVIKPFATTPVTSTDTPLGNDLVLQRMIKPTTYSANSNFIPAGDDYLFATSQAILYEDVDIPLGTRGFLFYGKAIDETPLTPITTDAEKHQYGILTPTGLDGSTLSAIQFQLNQIEPSPSAVASSDYATNIVNYLNKIAQAKNSSNQAWSDAPTGLIKDLYQTFIGTISVASRPVGGSTRNIMATVQELYASARENATLGEYVLDAILNSTPQGSTEKYATDTDNDGTLEFNATLLGDISTTDYFPANYGLPDGAAVVAWDETNEELKLVTTGTEANAFNPALNATAIDYYVYPPSLYYFANSAVKASNSVQRDNITDAMTWEQVLDLYSDNQVQLFSRSVIMAAPVDYGVGMLEVSVKCESATLADHEGSHVSYTEGGFPITAVLVGNQCHAGFDFAPTGETKFSLYDNMMPTGFKASYTTTEFSSLPHSRTLLLQSHKNEAVNVAVEFVNNSGDDFYGNNGDLISKGCKFYLIAQLTPEEGQTVFLQDHVTRAHLTIQNLENAYNVVPDLRLPKLDLGLLVNLDWQTGIHIGTIKIE